MIAVILAAGRGSRLGAFTDESPKSLLPLNDKKTILDYNLNILKKLGVEEIHIVTGFRSDKIRDHVASHPNINIIYNPFWNHCNVLGSLYMALPYLKQDFLFLHADTLVGVDAWEKLFHHQGEIILPYVSKICGEEEMKVRLDDSGNLLEISKTMDAKTADGEFLGIAKFTRGTVLEIQNAAINLFAGGKVNQYMEAVIQEFIEAKTYNISTFDIGDSPFVEIDFESDYSHAKDVFGNSDVLQ